MWCLQTVKLKNSDQTKGILPFSESALWVIITRHHDGQDHDRLAVTVTAYLSPHLCTPLESVMPGRATRANIDRCYIMSTSLAFLTCQRCLSSDHSSKKYTQKIFPQSDRITTLIWAGWKPPEGGEKTLVFDSVTLSWRTDVFTVFDHLLVYEVENINWGQNNASKLTTVFWSTVSNGECNGKWGSI